MKETPKPDYCSMMKNHRYHKQKHFHYYQKKNQWFDKTNYHY